MNLTFDKQKYDAVLDRGLCAGKGNPDSAMCVEAAVCFAMGLPHGDDPKCVAESVRSFAITLNDARWSSPKARAKGMRALGIAQLGSLGVVNDIEFARSVAKKTIQRILPPVLRSVGTKECDAAAERCECEGTADAADAAERAERAAAAQAAFVNLMRPRLVPLFEMRHAEVLDAYLRRVGLAGCDRAEEPCPMI